MPHGEQNDLLSNNKIMELIDNITHENRLEGGQMFTFAHSVEKAVLHEVELKASASTLNATDLDALKVAAVACDLVASQSDDEDEVKRLRHAAVHIRSLLASAERMAAEVTAGTPQEV